MSAVNAAEREALFALIDATGDNHVGPRNGPDPLYLPRSNTGGTFKVTWWKPAELWPYWLLVEDPLGPDEPTTELAVIDDFGTLVVVGVAP